MPAAKLFYNGGRLPEPALPQELQARARFARLSRDLRSYSWVQGVPHNEEWTTPTFGCRVLRLGLLFDHKWMPKPGRQAVEETLGNNEAAYFCDRHHHRPRRPSVAL